ncbi:MAG: VanZ family protein [Clostridia bacterium]|nr:VanZ family protein [Clostridia bacterium]
MNAVLHYFSEMGPFVLLTVPVWLLARAFWLAGKRQSPRAGRELLMALFVFYLIALASQTVLPLPDFRQGLHPLWESARMRIDTQFRINSIPLRTIRAFWHKGTFEQNLINLAGNVGIFLPMGLLPPLLWERWRKIWKTALLCLLASCGIEFCQLFLSRSVDVDDVILNLLGGLLGYLLFALGRAAANVFRKRRS